MKILVCWFALVQLVLALQGVDGADVLPKNDLERGLLNLFYVWRSGNVAALPIPLLPLDAIEVPPITGNYKGKGAKITYTTSDLLVTGTDNFSVDELDATEENLETSGILTFPKIQVTADDYKLDGRALLVYPLRGSGRMEVDILDVTLAFTLRLGSSGTGTAIAEFKFDFDIEQIKVNLVGSSWPINKVLTKEGLNILEGYHDSIISTITHNMIQHLNDTLATTTPSQFMQLIMQTNSL